MSFSHSYQRYSCEPVMPAYVAPSPGRLPLAQPENGVVPRTLNPIASKLPPPPPISAGLSLKERDQLTLLIYNHINSSSKQTTSELSPMQPLTSTHTPTSSMPTPTGAGLSGFSPSGISSTGVSEIPCFGSFDYSSSGSSLTLAQKASASTLATPTGRSTFSPPASLPPTTTAFRAGISAPSHAAAGGGYSGFTPSEENLASLNLNLTQPPQHQQPLWHPNAFAAARSALSIMDGGGPFTAAATAASSASHNHTPSSQAASFALFASHNPVQSPLPSASISTIRPPAAGASAGSYTNSPLPGPSSTSASHIGSTSSTVGGQVLVPPCSHISEWRRLRVHKGVVHFLCRNCKEKFRMTWKMSRRWTQFLGNNTNNNNHGNEGTDLDATVFASNDMNDLNEAAFDYCADDGVDDNVAGLP